MLPWRWAIEETVTTRAASDSSSFGSSRPVRAKWPRWLVPNWSSKPCSVSIRGGAMTPALLISRSSGAHAAEHVIGGLGDHVEVAEVERQRLDLGVGVLVEDVRHRDRGLLRVTAAEQDGRAGAGQRQRRLLADAAVGAGDQGGAPGQVGNVLGRPSIAHRKGTYPVGATPKATQPWRAAAIDQPAAPHGVPAPAPRARPERNHGPHRSVQAPRGDASVHVRRARAPRRREAQGRAST